MAKSWREIAETLAIQLQSHANCAEHTKSERDPNCPFCDDIVAFQEFQAKVRDSKRFNAVSIRDVPGRRIR